MSSQLFTRIQNALVESEFDQRPSEFLPEGVIDTLITEISIMRAFQGRKRIPKEEILTARSLAQSILEGNFRKTFAAAVMSWLEDEDLRLGIQQLVNAGISDSTLPVGMDTFFQRGVGSPQSQPQDEDETEDFEYDEDLGFPSPSEGDTQIWDSRRIGEFCKKQWLFLTPVFDISQSPANLEDLCVLPFTKKYSDSDSGNFGQVTKYEIYKSHLIKPGDAQFQCPKFVAIKELAVRNKDDRQNVLNIWGREADALRKMNHLKQPHIVEFYKAFRRGRPGSENHYLMLEWASGGNLRHLWKSFRRPALTTQLVKDTMYQVYGLVKAINKAHNPESGPNFRHGDLKPENILWFKDENGHSMGVLKIGDWGLAKQHYKVTEMRSRRTTTKWGTRRYEPPEEAYTQGTSLLVPDQSGKRRSRLYDIWALGCITLEFMVWLMYGPDELNRFNKGLEYKDLDNSRFYVIKENEIGKPEARVHDVAVEWIKHMAEDPICAPGSTALGDLLELIRDQLLVVKLPQRLGTHADLTQDNTLPFERDSSITKIINGPRIPKVDFPPSHGLPSIVIEDESGDSLANQKTLQPKLLTSGKERARADEILDRMTLIIDEDEDDDTERESYWLAGTPKSSKGPNVDDIRQRLESLSLGSLSLASTELISDEWNVLPDNDFAKRLLESIDRQSMLLPKIPLPHELCESCRDFQGRIWDPVSEVVYMPQHLQQHSGECALCRLIYATVVKRYNVPSDSTITIQRSGSSIKVNGEEPSILSVYRSLGLDTGINHEIQIGFPGLVDGYSDAYFEILRCWLENCNHKHKDTTCRASSSVAGASSATGFSSSRSLPTRLIYVGKQGDQKVYLRTTRPGDNLEWTALSHQWGTDKQFCTTTETIRDHIDGMDFHSLPATFKDAVIVTRELGRQYVWIDSICIVQGPGGDFNHEAKRMEQVYRGAYCVLAPSRSPGHYAGFLKPRNPRETVVLKQGKSRAPFYVCENIDDFDHHVLQGSLNQRGWVLQEHALARRTIYFTDSQTYFECGNGVQCETMAKLENEVASFLGDPNFPEVIMRADPGERILRYQDLFKKYSWLGLTEIWDRTMAIDGLQSQILKGLNAEGAYGILDDGSTKAGSTGGLLRRSLLWRRDNEVKEMTRIPFPTDHPIRSVPSWSWMARAGGIDYISPPFGGVDWSKLSSPWSSDFIDGTGDLKPPNDNSIEKAALVAEACDYDAAKAVLDGDGEIILDDPLGAQQPAAQCVVLGVKKGAKRLEVRDRMHYLLVVATTNRKDGSGLRIYERVGAGYLPGRCIGSQRQRICIH
ncbi:hypothetical protein F4808DRAFT_473132 [Astrocystis sublimbata]|nr:hypothetical protein F4808DRAFT_473132 [Astrocystis sublimbata]